MQKMIRTVGAQAPLYHCLRQKEAQVRWEVSHLRFSFVTTAVFISNTISHHIISSLFINSRRKSEGRLKTNEKLKPPKALNLSCLSSERNNCFASSNAFLGKWTCWVASGLLSDRRQQVGADFLNPSSWASADPKSSEWGFFHIYNDDLGIFHHQNWICNVSHFTYLAITHLRYQLQTSQETVMLMEFCQQPEKVFEGSVGKRNHWRIIRNPAWKVTGVKVCCQDAATEN